MTSKKSSGSFKPFENLDRLIRRQSKESVKINYRSTSEIKPSPVSSSATEENIISTSHEHDLFLKEMSDVKPIAVSRHQQKFTSGKPRNSAGPSPELSPAAEIVSKLEKLVKHGEGFVVENTSEYKEWTGFNVNPQITRRLHQGDFAIQEYIDLHGLNVDDAKWAFEIFLKESIETGKHAVLIVHGRGLSSPNEPVLKMKVYEWLTSGRWNKWIVAFSSARLCDGGAGATYVLLRQQALTKQRKKNVKGS